MKGSSYYEVSHSLVEDDAEKPHKKTSVARLTFTVMSLLVKMNGDIRFFFFCILSSFCVYDHKYVDTHTSYI